MTLYSKIYIGSNTHLIELVDLTDNAGTIQTTATVTLVTLTDAATGTAVTGLTLPLAMLHVGSGLYRATLPAPLSMTARKRYLATITASTPGGALGEWTERLTAQAREA